MKNSIFSGIIKSKNWKAQQLNASSGYLYWLEADLKLRRTKLTDSKKMEPTEIISNISSIQNFAINEEYIYWSDSFGKLSRGEIKQLACINIEVLDEHWGEKPFSIDGGTLYFSDSNGQLNCGVVKNGQLNISSTQVSENWTATHFVVENNQICWSEADNQLRLGDIVNGKLSEVHEMLLEDWQPKLWTGTDEHLYWVDSSNYLWEGKRINSAPNHLHFKSDIDWANQALDNRYLRVYVRTFDSVLKYQTELSRENHTGIPYAPACQNWEYIVDMQLVFWNGRNLIIEARYPYSEAVSVQHGSKMASLKVGKVIISSVNLK